MSVVCQTERQESEVRQALASGTARIIRIEAGTTLRCLARVAGMFPGCNIAVLPFGFAYAPADLLSRASAHHLREGNNYTQVLGLPRGAAPEIYSPDVLIKLSELRLPGLPTAPGQALEAILRATSAASVQPPLPIHARPFMADADYAATPHQLPERVVIEGPEDIEVARRVDSLRHTDTNPLGELRLWREVSVAQSMEDRRLFAALAPRPRRRISALAPPLRILYVSYPSAFSGGEQS
ncbi:MAG: hypothetical protein ACRD4Q_11010, partial [Candidatus Acidiferrales bacterium]